ncbi:glycosyltransferase family 4 protein [Algoriphagus lutimaris]|uniref:glycosyltransferase family 4 protein n=1 Tax=Algoriphagus lutimaris TaxID=613197 RepID=UPI00196B55D6|nr:glycosyltransferase family 4 protein [Algoriphagus lutimaris]MBN3520927.1 glycosyltransferase family 4 protein [Algoriphagus lutimaris]
MGKSSNVLFLQSSSELYGSGKILLQVLRIYRDQGLNPVVVMTGEGPLGELMESEGFIVKVQNLGILRRKYVNAKGLVNRFSKNYKAYRFLDQLHQEFQFELVYSNTLAVIVGAYWAKKNKLAHIWHIHEIVLGPSPLVKLLAKVLDSSTPNPIVVSEAVKKHWETKLKVAKPEVIHNGIPYEEYMVSYSDPKADLGLPEDKLVITMVGRINPGKGQLFFLEIAKRILQTYPQCHFVLVGDPFPGYESIQEEIKSVIRDNGLQESVSDLGFRKDIPEVLAATDIFMLPSILPDSFPTVILEAMASGKPVIATQSGGAEEMVEPGKTGYLIPIGDVEKGVEALKTLILDKEKIKSFGEAGRSKVLIEYNLNTFKEKMQKHLWRHLNEN